MKRDSLDPLMTEAARTRVPLVRRGRKDTMALAWIDPPAPQASFGYVNDWVEIEHRIAGAADLIIPFDPQRLGWIDVKSLRMFRFGRDTKTFDMVAHSRVYENASVVYAPITRPGAYGIIGLHRHPLVRETIRLFCELRPRIGNLPERGRRAFRDRICDLILCAGDMRGFFESRAELDLLVGELGKDGPAGMPPLISRPAFDGETICDRCHGAGGFIPEIPECRILEDPVDGPCRLAEWENVGPVHISGVIRQIVIDPNVPRRVYVVSANGGIWRLGDKDDYPNTQWRPLTERLPNLRFRVMAVAPSNSATLYAATSTKTRPFGANTVISEIYVSTNFGGDWTAIPGMGVVHRLVVHPFNRDTVFAAASTGLWLQTVAGGGWANLFPGDCLDVALDPDESSIVYLGVRGIGLFKSFTSGATWPVAPILAFDPNVTSDDPTTAANEVNTRQTIKIALGRRNRDGTSQSPLTRTVVVRFGNQINVHPNGGDGPGAWRQVVPSQIVPNPDPNTVAMRPNIDAALNDLAGGNIRRSDTFPRQANEWVNCLAVDPFDPDHIFVGSVGVLESTDGGQTWNLRGSLAHEDHHSIVFHENEQGLVFVGNDGGLFLSVAGGATWPSMSLAATEPSSAGTNLARGLITSEFKSTAIRRGRCLAAIDHTGFVLSEDFETRWQFLFNGPESSARHGHEGSFVFACPASVDRYYVFNNRIGRNGDDPTNVRGRLAQFDFTRTSGLVDPPAFSFLTTGLANDLPAFFPPQGNFFPDDSVYDGTILGPFAIRFSEDDDERLILYGTARSPTGDFMIQSLRLATNGTAVTASAIEATDASAFCAIVFVPPAGDRAFAITQNGRLFERDFSDPAGLFTAVSQFAMPAGDPLPSRLVPVRSPELHLYAISQTAIGRYDDDGQPVTPLYTAPNPNEERLMSLAAHPSRDGTLFLGTTRGVYLSENGGADWTPYRQGMPSVPITHLVFDQGFLYAATFGRGLWRCRPCG